LEMVGMAKVIGGRERKSTAKQRYGHSHTAGERRT